MGDFVIAKVRPRTDLRLTMTSTCTVINLSIYCVVLGELLSLPRDLRFFDLALIAIPVLFFTRAPSPVTVSSSFVTLLPPRRSTVICLLASPAFGFAGTLLSSVLVFLGLNTRTAKIQWSAWVSVVAVLAVVRICINPLRRITIYRWDECLPN
jgi:hypothetical protein